MKELNASDFKMALAGKKPLVVDFWAAWCGPCKALAPVFEATSVVLGDKAEFAKVDVDAPGNDEVAQDYDVRGIPCVIVFSNGEEVDRIVGVLPQQQFEKKIKELIGR